MGLIALLGGLRGALFAALAVAALLLAGVQTTRLQTARDTISDLSLKAAKDAAAAAAAQVIASESAREREQATAKAANEVAAAYEQGKRDAQAEGNRVADGLRAGNLRLRKQWRGCEAGSVPSPADPAGQPDAAAADRAGSAGRIVAAADACDAQVTGLQDFIRSER